MHRFPPPTPASEHVDVQHVEITISLLFFSLYLSHSCLRWKHTQYHQVLLHNILILLYLSLLILLYLASTLKCPHMCLAAALGADVRGRRCHAGGRLGVGGGRHVGGV